MQVLEKILQEIEKMPYPLEGIGCGLEDSDITDRYVAAAYGWNEAVEKIFEIIRSHMEDDGWIPVEERLPENNTDVLCLYLSKQGFNQMAVGHIEDCIWWVSKGRGDYTISCGDFIAWQPLPAPYQPKEGDYDKD